MISSVAFDTLPLATSEYAIEGITYVDWLVSFPYIVNMKTPTYSAALLFNLGDFFFQARK